MDVGSDISNDASSDVSGDVNNDVSKISIAPVSNTIATNCGGATT
jgi:hypothetical protein